MSELTITSAQEWRTKRESGIEITLPEYNDVVRIREMNAFFFIHAGKIPDYLTETVQNLIDGRENSVKQPEQDKIAEFRVWIDELMKWTFVSPKVVDNPQGDNEIGVDDIGWIDKMHIYRFFGQPAQMLRGFRLAPIKPMAPVDAPEVDGAKAKQGARDKKVG